MKTIKALFSILIILTGSLTLNAQSKDAAEVKAMIESKNYVFKAQRANPQTGRSRALTPEYDLTVSANTVISYLPYFGRAYTAPISGEGGIKFTSTNFNYEAKADKKGWDISIFPKDVSDVQQMYLDVFDNGYATLRVVSTNRQSISFNGYIEKGK